MANISRLATQITANADQFNKVMDRVEKRVNKTQQNISKKTGTVGVSIPDKLNTATKSDSMMGKLHGLAGGGISRALGGIKTGISAIGAVSGIAALGVTALLAGVVFLSKAGTDQALSFRRAGREVGETTENYAAYSTALKLMGVDAEEAKSAILNLANSISEAKTGDKIKMDTFKNLKIELNDASPVENFKKIAESFSGISSASERAYTAYKLFGDKASTVLPLLSMQKDELSGIMNKAKEFGTVIGDKQADQIEGVAIKFRELKESILGVGTQIAVAILPVFLALFKAMQRVIGDGSGISKVFKAVGNVVVTVFHYINEAWTFLNIGIQLVKAGMNSLAIGFLRVVRGIVEGAKYLSDAMGDVSPFVAMNETLDGLTEKIEYYRTARQEAFGEVNDLRKSRTDLEDMKSAIAGIGNEAEALAKSFHKGDDAVRQLAIRKKLFEEAMNIEQSVINPLETFQSEITKLDVLLDEGVLKWETYARAVGMAVDKLAEASHMNNITLPTAARGGSADAVGAISKSKAERELRNIDPQKRIADILGQSQTIQRQIAVYSQQTAAAVSNRQPVKLP